MDRTWNVRSNNGAMNRLEFAPVHDGRRVPPGAHPRRARHGEDRDYR
jgi:hypothetical protein